MEPSDYVERKDPDGRVYFSAIVHWRHARGPAHCLLQAVFLAGSQLKLFLAQLKTCPSFRGIFFDPEAAANAAWTALEEHFGDLSHLAVEWVFRSGQYSSYDRGVPSDTARHVLTLDSHGKWHYRKYDNVLLTSEEVVQLVRVTNVPAVEADLEQLPRMPPLDPLDF